VTSSPPVVLTIAGYDPSSGAGITADIKTIAAHGCFGVSCITAMTVQSTQGVKRVEPTSAEMVREMLFELARDVNISAVHVGMLGSGPVAAAVAKFLKEHRFANVVLDPVLQSSSGTELLDSEGIEILRSSLMPLATVITPNLDEASVLTGAQVKNIGQMRSAASRLHAMGAANLVITGGHLPQPIDLLSTERGARVKEFPAERIESRATHGTGCAFATALACNLALGRSLPQSVQLAGKYVRQAIAAAYLIGQGRGPIHHLHNLENHGNTGQE
jgi:hydroxymethylpyrimidine/phosphomethylpyrimidine kinase